MRLHTILLLGVAAMQLSACAYIGRNVQRAGTEVHEGTVALDQRMRNWLYSDAADVEESRKPKPDTGYCYRTLGEVSCYPRRIAGQESRMVGLQMPEPTFGVLNTPIPVGKPSLDYRDLEGERQEAEEAAAPMPAPDAANAAHADAYNAELTGKPVIYDAPVQTETVLEPMVQPQTEAPRPLIP